MNPGRDPARRASRIKMKAAKEVTIGMPMGSCFIVMKCVGSK